jgi:ankyrin repeat protein
VDNGKAEICRILFEHGVDLSLTDSTGRTIAHHIARAADFEILSCFLPYNEIDWKRSEGAEFHDFEKDCAGQYGLAPLHLAAKYNFVGFILKLYDLKILEDLDPQCGGNLRPLHWAADSGNSVVIEALLARGADVNAVTTVKGRTALHWAANEGHFQAVLALIRGGANFELLDKDGCSAAALTSNPAILHELKAASMTRGKSCTQRGGRRAISHPVIDSAIRNSLVSPAGVALESTIPADPRTLKLIKACEEGNLMLCRQLLSLGVDCNGCSDSDSPLLVTMAKSPTGPSNTYTDLVAFLIDSGADTNCHASAKFGRHGYQAIHYAIWNDSHDILRKLLNKNVQMSDFGLEPIHIAAFQGRTTCLAILLDYECAKRMLNVQVAEQDQFPKKCLQQGIYALEHLSTGTALHLAAHAGQDEAVSMLIEYGADVNNVNARGWTPLHLAVHQGKIKTVKLLLDAGAELSVRTRQGRSPFLISLDKSRTEIMEELILRSSDIMALDAYGRGAAFHAPIKRNPEILSRLQELGVPFNIRDNFGQTPLEAGLRDGLLSSSAKDAIKFFVKNTDLFDGNISPHGNTLNMACASAPSSIPPFIRPILERLLEEGTPETISSYINNYSEYYGTPLYAASFRGELEAMNMLLDAGADLASTRGPLGNALNAACAMGRVDAIKWLLQHGSGPVGDEAMQLASKHTFATKLLNQYKEIGVEALNKEPEVIPVRRLKTRDTDLSLPTAERNSTPEDMAPIPVTPNAPRSKDLGPIGTVVKEQLQHALQFQQVHTEEMLLSALTQDEGNEGSDPSKREETQSEIFAQESAQAEQIPQLASRLEI